MMEINFHIKIFLKHTNDPLPMKVIKPDTSGKMSLVKSESTIIK